MADQQPSGSGSGAPPPQGKAIASLAKKQSDVTRLGTQKIKFVPTLPPRRVKEEPKKEEPAAASASSDRGRGRGADRARGRGRGRGGAGEGRGGGPPRPPQVEMTASGPFAMGPALAGMSGPRRPAARSTFAPAAPTPYGGAAALGAGLTQTTAPSLKREKGAQEDRGPAGKVGEEEVYSDPDEGVDIVDMENVRQMDWMAPESLHREREAGRKKRSTVKREEGVRVKTEEGATRASAMDVDRETPPEEAVNMANAVDLSESEDEEELEDIIDDFAQKQEQIDEPSFGQELLYFFQFPEPFPVFEPRPAPPTADAKGKGRADPGNGEESTKKVTFAEDTKPPAHGGSGPDASEKAAEDTKLDGVVGQLEIYESGAVKMRLKNGILMDITAATRPSFLQHAVYLDPTTKRLCVLGEVNRRFVATPDLDTLLNAMDAADAASAFDLGDGLLTMES
ncbi:RNA polymerase III RPC4-domain-containing protein [Epithele typhae]|uniref:RNA polymerase III RPC4-domain-containing protein n=1 Tax=Epithele typhae TaxID=378194 RepID=UPI0020080B94|nr:RNA polymerase III RPC4-domain-containing protein [Epithele typhae]KAH9935927.1 RNA polymerase III RPC4-domain-containing protein [Epithele typhae]